MYYFKQPSWLEVSGAINNLKDESWEVQYVYSYYWAVTTTISVGYGDITPKNISEVIWTTFTMFSSCIVFAYSINSIWEILRKVSER